MTTLFTPPPEVWDALNELQQQTDSPNTPSLLLLTQLCKPNPEQGPGLQKFWEAMKRHHKPHPFDDTPTTWVKSALSLIESSFTQAETLITQSEASKESRLINSKIKSLQAALAKNSIEIDFVHSDSKTFPGIYCLQELSPENQAVLTDNDRPTITLDSILEGVDRASASILFERSLPTGQQAKNSAARSFAKSLSRAFKERFELELLDSIATVTNALFNTTYEASAIQKIINKQ